VGPNVLKPRRHDTALRSFIAQVVRTRRLFYLSRPGQFLWISTLIVSLATLVLPYTRLGQLFGLIPLPAWVMASLIVFTGLYVVAAEMAKKFFYKRVTF
jgi:Mg2+-importing ATPase